MYLKACLLRRCRTFSHMRWLHLDLKIVGRDCRLYQRKIDDDAIGMDAKKKFLLFKNRNINTNKIQSHLTKNNSVCNYLSALDYGQGHYRIFVVTISHFKAKFKIVRMLFAVYECL